MTAPQPQAQPRLRLPGRRILITGGASGVGLAAAKLCLAEGAQVVLIDRDAEALAAAQADLGVTGFACDVSSAEQVTAAVAAAAAAMGGLDGLMHSAGVLVSKGLQDTDLATWRQVIDINLTGTFLICQAVLPWLQKVAGATIVNVASATGLMPTHHVNTAYASSKAGVIGFSRAIAAELAPGVRVNVVCPGAVDTPMTSRFMERDAAGKPMGFEKTYALGRPATAEEIGQALVYLTSSDSAFITGIAMAVDGGRTYH